VTPARIRRATHALHAVTSLALIATGLLMEFPDLRAWLVGGYGLQIANLHDWVGAAFIAAPGLALALAARPLARDLRRRLGPPDGVTWKKIHLLASLVAAALLTVTGALLWLGGLPLAVEDAALEVHSILSWVLAGSIPLHLVAARRKIVDLVAVRLGLREPPELGFPFDDEEKA
jgi:cytochrome b subunit of formate dehydrogenase